MKKWNSKKKRMEETGSGREENIGFLSEITGSKGSLKSVDKERKKASSTKSPELLKIPGIKDWRCLPEKNPEDFDFMAVYKATDKKSKPYSLPEIPRMPEIPIVPSSSEISNRNAFTDQSSGGDAYDDEQDNTQAGGGGSFFGFRAICLIFAFLVLGCILASATVALLLFFSTPAGRTVSVLAVLVIFIWMKKKGWLPL